jgi:hypothetical protein
MMRERYGKNGIGVFFEGRKNSLLFLKNKMIIMKLPKINSVKNPVECFILVN